MKANAIATAEAAALVGLSPWSSGLGRPRRSESAAKKIRGGPCGLCPTPIRSARSSVAFAVHAPRR